MPRTVRAFTLEGWTAEGALLASDAVEFLGRKTAQPLRHSTTTHQYETTTPRPDQRALRATDPQVKTTDPAVSPNSQYLRTHE